MGDASLVIVTVKKKLECSSLQAEYESAESRSYKKAAAILGCISKVQLPIQKIIIEGNKIHAKKDKKDDHQKCK